jgi:hypothetical protein
LLSSVFAWYRTPRTIPHRREALGSAEPTGDACTQNSEGIPMSEHRFIVGQRVDYTPLSSGVVASNRGYEVLRLLPTSGNQLQYRIKSAAEPFERMVNENELSLRL